jgi:hypothetical protein
MSRKTKDLLDAALVSKALQQPKNSCNDIRLQNDFKRSKRDFK